jgi:hypothetical protein
VKILLDTAKETLTVDGVTMSLDVVRQLANPDAAMFYKFERNADEVICQAFKLEQFGAPKYQN